MSFKLEQVEGTVEELDADLSTPALHEREEFVVGEIKKAIYHVVSSLGGYLSVSCNGNINPVSGEPGDVVNIYITSLPAPTKPTPAQTPPVEEVQTGEPTSVIEESPQPVVEPPPTTEVPVTPLNPEGKTNEEIEKEAQENMANAQQETAPSESPVETSPGQAEAQEIAQAAPPVEPAV